MNNNPLLARSFRIPFKIIQADHVEPGVKDILSRAQARIDDLAKDPSPRSYENTIQALDEVAQEVSETLTPIHHLLSVAETPELREAFNSVLPEITQFWSHLTLNEGLWNQLKAFADTSEAKGLEGIYARHVEKTLREFRRAGANLPPEKKDTLDQIRLELAKLEQKFSENVLDATAAYSLQVSESARLDGIPEGPLGRFREKAQEEELDGWLLTLDFPSYEPVMKYCRDRSLREEIYVAYVGRCRGDDFP